MSDAGDLDVIGLEERIVRHQHETLNLGLGDNHAIEGITMVPRKLRDPKGVLMGDREGSARKVATLLTTTSR